MLPSVLVPTVPYCRILANAAVQLHIISTKMCSILKSENVVECKINRIQY